jgi:hypothetical protein
MRKMLTAKDLAKRWGIPEQTFASWRQFDRGPKYLKIGRSVRYPENFVEEYEAAACIEPSQEVA